MYLHLGLDKMVLSKHVIGIFDLDNTTTAAATREFLTKAEGQKKLETVGFDLPKSFVVCSENRQNTVIVSQIAPPTLKRRAEKTREE